MSNLYAFLEQIWSRLGHLQWKVSDPVMVFPGAFVGGVVSKRGDLLSEWL